MKPTIILSLLALIICATVSAQPQDSVKKENSFEMVLIPEKVSPAFRLYVQNPEKKKIELQIKHAVYGNVVDTTFSTGQFSRLYNFELVADGRYVVTLSNGREKIIRTVEINTITTRKVAVNN